VLILFHSAPEGRWFELPKLVRDISWRMFIDTQQESPGDIYPALDGPALPADGRVWLTHHSLVCFVSAEASMYRAAASTVPSGFTTKAPSICAISLMPSRSTRF
jgi:hypothetical protein